MTRKSIKSGRTTLADVAHECGYSTSTVSIVLNEKPLARYLAEQTKVLIRDTAKRLGYRPDAAARSLRSRRSLTVGIMVFDISDPFCTLILKGIQKTLQPTNYLPLIMDAHNEPKQFERYLQMMLERRLEGLIIIANWLFVDINMLAELEREQMPLALIGRESGSMTSFVVDNEAGGHAALKHLYELGHRDIAIIRGPVQLGDSSKRWAGMDRFAKTAGLTLHPRLIVDLPETSDPNSGFIEGYALTKRLLDGRKRFTAVAAFDDLTAFGVIRALHDEGLRVPEDCSVIGFDDIPYAALSSPSLTTVHQPMEEMGRRAAERVLSGIDDAAHATPSKQYLLPPAVAIRESTGRLPRR
ncbi:LacI family transcriptional regulator [Edaphobacter acidisoli]|uniref:LacI family transcriptional regulator n=1 Tax=Edaphobacter acidisoli TaxID=2040573 RepID=A0A916RFG8_9BACT|nr:LacI family DNA-binding transcriptional regulator [Edaphobacter acidisoli]GGA55061.1 LacI family transcriptional regulator [Edaphobacter acidisoli]